MPFSSSTRRSYSSRPEAIPTRLWSFGMSSSVSLQSAVRIPATWVPCSCTGGTYSPGTCDTRRSGSSASQSIARPAFSARRKSATRERSSRVSPFSSSFAPGWRSVRSLVKSYVATMRVLFWAAAPRFLGFSNGSASSSPFSSRFRNAGCVASMPLSTTAQRRSPQFRSKSLVAASALTARIEREIAARAGRFRSTRHSSGSSDASATSPTATRSSAASTSCSFVGSFFARLPCRSISIRPTIRISHRRSGETSPPNPEAPASLSCSATCFLTLGSRSFSASLRSAFVRQTFACHQ